MKKYGTLFICLKSRAVHIGCTCSTDAFIYPRRGNITTFCCGESSFVGTQRKPAQSFKGMDYQKIQYFLENFGSF